MIYDKIKISELEETIEKDHSELDNYRKEYGINGIQSTAAYKKYIDTNSKLSFLYVAKNDQDTWSDDSRDVKITRTGNTINIDPKDRFSKIQIFEKEIGQSLAEAIKSKILLGFSEKCIVVSETTPHSTERPTGWDQYAILTYDKDSSEFEGTEDYWEYIKKLNCPKEYMYIYAGESENYFIANNNSNLFFYINAPRGPAMPKVTLWEESLKIDR